MPMGIERMAAMDRSVMGLIEKLLEIQAEGTKLVKDAKNPHFKNEYITLDSLLDVMLPILNEKGILLIQMPTAVGPNPALQTALVDAESGETYEGTMPLVLQKADPQGVGSAITYARRYMLMSALGLVADADDDGEAARVEGDATVPATWG